MFQIFLLIRDHPRIPSVHLRNTELAGLTCLVFEVVGSIFSLFVINHLRGSVVMGTQTLSGLKQLKWFLDATQHLTQTCAAQ